MKNNGYKYNRLPARQSIIVSMFTSMMLLSIFIQPSDNKKNTTFQNSSYCQLLPHKVRPILFGKKAISRMGRLPHNGFHPPIIHTYTYPLYTGLPSESNALNTAKKDLPMPAMKTSSIPHEKWHTPQGQSFLSQQIRLTTQNRITNGMITTRQTTNPIMTSLEDVYYTVDRNNIENLQDLLPTIDLMLKENYTQLMHLLKIKVKGFDKGSAEVEIGLQKGHFEAESVLLSEYDVSLMHTTCVSDDEALIVIPSKVRPLERMLDQRIEFLVKSEAADGVEQVIKEMFDEYTHWNNDRFLEKLEMIGISSDDIIEEYRSFIFAENRTIDYDYQLA